MASIFTLLKLARQQTERLRSSNFARSCTIFAVSSGQGKCGVAVVRVSGPQAQSVLRKVAGLRDVVPERKALLRKLRNPLSGDIIDRGLVLWFPAPRSFTGEDTCELHVHGGRAVVAATLSALSHVPDCRPAHPGEFTRRAFHAGKLSLTEVEGLADLLQAETDAQRRQALLQLGGHLGHVYDTWKVQLTQFMAHLEAFIDFSENEDVGAETLVNVRRGVAELVANVERHLTDGRRGEMLRSGVQIAILGQPNVGKSSLLNSLAQRPAAIVSSTAGTTRDVVQLSMDIGGYPVRLSDTAGLRESEDAVELEGIARARVSAAAADLVLLVVEAPRALAGGPDNLPRYLEHYIRQCQLELKWQDCIVVLNKLDLCRTQSMHLPLNIVLVSLLQEEGLHSLLQVLQEKLAKICGEPSRECPSLTHARHRAHLEKCVHNLRAFLDFGESCDIVLAAERLRLALRQLGLLTGTVTSEQLLDVIFSDFCIGK